mgnify:CR=1 FL=1
MKKLTLLLCLLITANVYGQQVPPQGINFQAVLFDEYGTPVPSLNENSTLNNQSAEATFTFYNFSSGLNYYIETHSISTDEFGRFQVVLGRGTPLGSNTFQNIQWSDGNIFLDFEVSIDGQANRLISSQELLSVPYALFSGGVTGASDLDPDPNNEIQELALDADSIYITKGNAIPIPLDGDKSSSNELQSLSISGNTITLSNGNTVSLPPVLDTSPTNELQSLSTQGDSLTISNGNTVLTDPSSTNELQVLSIQGGDLTITNGNTVTLPVSLDNDSTNEIQKLELSSKGYLKLSKSNDSVMVSTNLNNGGSNSSLSLNDNTSCWKGEPEVFPLACLNTYSSVQEKIVFDSTAYFKGSAGGTNYLIHVNLYQDAIISAFPHNQNWMYQGTSQGYIVVPGFVIICNNSGILDTITAQGIKDWCGIAYPDNDFTWFTPTAIKHYNSATQNTSSSLFAFPSTISNIQGVGNDSILLDNKLYNKNTMAILQTYNLSTSTTSSGTTFTPWQYSYHPKIKKILYGVYTSNIFSTWRCDLDGTNSVQITSDGSINGRGATIDGKSLVKLTANSGVGIVFNGYIMYGGTINQAGQTSFQSSCLIAVDGMNGNVYPVKNNAWYFHSNAFYRSYGEYTALYSTAFDCIVGSTESARNALLRWNR